MINDFKINISGFFIFLIFTLNLVAQDKQQINQVYYYGALKNFMHHGDLSAKITLAKLVQVKNLYALGALEHLKGEIQIFDGQPLVSQVVDSVLQFDRSFDQKASLLVLATVKKWRSFPVPDTVDTYKQLESFIVQQAGENKIYTDKPFPFLVEGIAKSIDWHVINWKAGDLNHTHEKHMRSGLFGRLQDVAVEMLGFYSDAHHGIFTHHSTNMHIHMKTGDHKVAGHVDDLTLGPKMMLKLPDLQN